MIIIIPLIHIAAAMATLAAALVDPKLKIRAPIYFLILTLILVSTILLISRGTL